MNLLRHVDLCSGIGGFALGFQWANLSKPIMFCDIEPWSRQILSKHWPDVPIATDVKELANDPDGLIPDCDILTAGYPCQPFSLAGERRGAQDDRHIWPHIFSIVQRKRPSWCVFENVYGHVSMGLDEVLSDLEGESYATRPFVVPACATDAPHRRDRLWIICRNVGNTENERYKQWSDVEREGAEDKQEQRLGVRSEPSGSSEDVADTDSERLQGQWRQHEFVSEREAEHSVGSSGEEVRDSKTNVSNTVSKRQQGSRSRRDAGNKKTHGKGKATQPINGSVGSFWEPEPRVGRVANGVSKRVDRLRGLGNAIVPQIAMRIGQTIKQIEEQDGR